MNVTSKVPPGFKNIPIADYLGARFTYLPVGKWLELTENGRLTCNGRLCTPETRVRQGDSITCAMPDFEPPPVNLNVGIIYEDEWLLAVDKPPGLRVHSRGKFVTANLSYFLRYQHEPPYPEAQLANRLDADTSGIVLLARDKETRRRLGVQFAANQVEKRYLAIVNGRPQPPNGVIDLPIRKTPGTKVARHEAAPDGGGKTAVTHYQTLQILGPKHTLLALQPQTGRTHQLRVHLAAVGHPLVGDGLYQMGDEDYLYWVRNGRSPAKMPLIQRQALHCAVTQFRHPATGEICRLEAPLPNDMARLIEALKEDEEEGGG